MTDKKALRAEELMPDDKDYLEKNGVRIRKGTMAACLANMEVLESSHATHDQKRQAKQVLKELAPTLRALGFFEHFCCKSPAAQPLFESIVIF